MPRLILIFCFVIASHISLNAQTYHGALEGQKLDWLFSYLSDYYVDSLDNSHLADLAIRRIVEELDPFSSYQSKAEADAQLNKDNGITPLSSGFTFYLVNGGKPIITYINREGPAEKAGLKKGYELLKINDKNLSGLNSYEIEQIVKDTSYNTLKIDYLDTNKVNGTTSLTKGNSPWFSVLSYYMIDESIGYIKLQSFTKNTLTEFQNALSELKKLGLQSLILDLRNNAGGVKNQSISLANEFLDGKKLINYSEGFNMEREEYFSSEGGSFLKGKVVCLTDKYTASSSELFLSALQEWDRALIIGTPSYGKGLIQQSYKLGDGSTIRLTIGRYYTPTGRSIQKPQNDTWFENIEPLLPENGILSQAGFGQDYILKTKGQRTVVKGTGGVYPDIYFAAPPIDKKGLERFNAGGDLYRFTTNLIHENRSLLINRFKTFNAFEKDENLLLELSYDFKQYLLRNDFQEGSDPNYGVPKNVMEKSKSWIASQLWNDNAYYQVKNESDATIQKAVEVIKGDYFRKMGIKK